MDKRVINYPFGDEVHVDTTNGCVSKGHSLKGCQAVNRQEFVRRC